MKAFYILSILLATLLPSKAIQYVVQTDGSNVVTKPNGFWASQPGDFTFSNAVNVVLGNTISYLTNGLATTNYVNTAIQAATNGISSAQVTNIYLTVQNNTGSVVSNGAAVTITTGTGSLPRITLAVASTNLNAAGFDCIGLASGDIANGGQGSVCVLGTVGNFATDGWITGSTLWLSTNAGALTTNPPPSNFDHVIVGSVARANSNNGVVFVQPNQAVRFGDIGNATNIVISIANAQGYLTSIPASATNQFLTSVPVSATNWIVIQSTNGFLSNADTNTLKAQAGAAIAGSNYLTSIATNVLVAQNGTATNVTHFIGSGLTAVYYGTNVGGAELTITNSNPAGWAGITAQGDKGNFTTNYVGMYFNNSAFVPGATWVGSTNDGILEYNGANAFVDVIGGSSHLYFVTRTTTNSAVQTNVDATASVWNFKQGLQVNGLNVLTNATSTTNFAGILVTNGINGGYLAVTNFYLKTQATLPTLVLTNFPLITSNVVFTAYSDNFMSISWSNAAACPLFSNLFTINLAQPVPTTNALFVYGISSLNTNIGISVGTGNILGTTTVRPNPDSPSNSVVVSTKTITVAPIGLNAHLQWAIMIPR